VAWTKILAVAGVKLGEAAAKEIISEYGGENAEHYRKILLGNDKASIEDYLSTVDSKLVEIKDTVKSTELRQIFAPYNQAEFALTAMYEAYTANGDKPVDDQARQNACHKVLGETGAFDLAGKMIVEICHPRMPNNKSLLQEYSDLLLSDYNDVFRYCDRIRAVTDHLKIRLIGAATLRSICSKGVPSPSTAKDVPITANQIKAIDVHLQDTIRPGEEIRVLFEHVAAAGASIRLQHCNSGNYLTGYEDGTALSDDEPFSLFVIAIGRNSDRHGMPQIFVYKQIKETQIEKYLKSTNFPWLPVRNEEIKVTLEIGFQLWRVKLRRVENETVVMFVNAHSGKALAGIRQKCVYLRPFDETDQSTWWQPVATPNADGKYDGRQFMLKHWVDGKALDANGKSVYSGDRTVNHSNNFMKWRIDNDVKALTSTR
jgi:hypothetical protein